MNYFIIHKLSGQKNVNLSRRKQILRIMRISSFLLFFCSMVVCATDTYSQKARVTMKHRNVHLETVLNDIEDQTDYLFLYNGIQIDITQNVSVYAKNKPVNQVLSELFSDSPVQFAMEGTHIVLMHNKNEVLSGVASYQQITITGMVTDPAGDPLPGVNVKIKDSMLGTVTNSNGVYSLLIPEGNATLIFSFIGYVTQEVKIDNQRIINIMLMEDTQQIDEVVVVGYGTQKKVNLTGAISAFSGADLAKRQVGQSSMLLQGIAPGVVVTQRSGQPGSDSGAISIRGKTTLRGDGGSPLILVDGIEMGINNIDPSLIESVSILKDAASSAIYGVRAANGVILITTKRAQKDHFSVNYNGYVGWQNPIKLPKKVNALDHMNMINEAYTNIGSSKIYSDEYIREYEQYGPTNRDRYPDTDWYDLILTNSGFMQNHFLTVSGGSQRIRALASIGYLDQKGIIENTGYKRYSLRLNTDMQVTTFLNAWVDAHINQGKRTQPSQGTGFAFYEAERLPADRLAILSDGRWGNGWNGENPLAFTNDGGLGTYDLPSVTLNIGLKFQPTNWLWADVMFAPNYWQEHQSIFLKAIQTYRWDGSAADVQPQYSTLWNRSYRSNRNMLKSSLNAEKTFGNHYLKGLLVYQQEVYHGLEWHAYRERYMFPDYPELNAGGESNQRAQGTQYENALISGIGRLNYEYNNRYLFEATLRIDASSRFASGKRTGYFPSVSAGWRISQEKFWLPLSSTINNMKLRASWGELGNHEMGNYPTQTVVNVRDPKYVFNKQAITGAALTAMANPELVWERTTMYNVGLDMTIFKHLNIVAEYYYKVSNDILLELDIPLSIGLSKPFQNAGKMENRGWEFGINYSNWDNEFKYDIGFNISDVKNKILDLKGVQGTGLTTNREGHEMFSLFALESLGLITDADFANGVYQHASQYGAIAPGDIKYKDQNDDGVINDKDRVVIGGTIPRFTYGLSAQLYYKGFDLGLQLQGVGKANGYLYNQSVMPFISGGSAMEMHKDRWTNENPNPNARFPRFAFNASNNQTNSSFWMKNAAYLRVKNVQLGYTLPKQMTQKLSIQKLRFYVSGQNILTFDNFWEYFDVEAPVGAGDYYPQMKSFCMGVDITF